MPYLLRLKEMCLRIAHVMTLTLASSTRLRTLLATHYLVGQGLLQLGQQTNPHQCVVYILYYSLGLQEHKLLSVLRCTYILADPFVRDL